MSPDSISTMPRRARRRLIAVVAVGALASLAATCQAAKPPAPPPPSPPPSQYCHDTTPANAQQYQQAFDGLRATNTAHWVASDGGLPVPLQDGRVLWMFGDTILGSPPNGPLKSHILFNNGFVVQQENCFTPINEPIKDPGPNEWVWPTGAVQPNSNTLLVFGLHMQRGGTPPFDFQLVSVDVARFSLSNLNAPVSVTPLPLPSSPSYGETLMFDNGFVYAYGHRLGSFPFEHYVARAQVNQLFNANAWWFWYDETPQIPDDEPLEGWKQADPDAADPMAFENGEPPLPLVPGIDEGPTAAFPVARTPAGGYVGSAFRLDAYGRDFIETWAGDEPQGPWILHDPPVVDITKPPYGPLTEEQLAYGGRVVFGIDGAPIALWSTNHESFDAVLANPNLYKVWFAQPQDGSIP
ncbi:MAG: hypothetical protein ACRDY4_11205 [Acidimicrobiia bacterium]